jgi:hypothetical protein
MLTACASSPAEIKLRAVAIPNDCAALGQPVQVTAPKKGDDARSVAARYAAGVGLANKRLRARNTCEAIIRKSYGK